MDLKKLLGNFVFIEFIMVRWSKFKKIIENLMGLSEVYWNILRNFYFEFKKIIGWGFVVWLDWYSSGDLLHMILFLWFFCCWLISLWKYLLAKTIYWQIYFFKCSMNCYTRKILSFTFLSLIIVWYLKILLYCKSKLII